LLLDSPNRSSRLLYYRQSAIPDYFIVCLQDLLFHRWSHLTPFGTVKLLRSARTRSTHPIRTLLFVPCSSDQSVKRSHADKRSYWNTQFQKERTTLSKGWCRRISAATGDQDLLEPHVKERPLVPNNNHKGKPLATCDVDCAAYCAIASNGHNLQSSATCGTQYQYKYIKGSRSEHVLCFHLTCIDIQTSQYIIFRPYPSLSKFSRARPLVSGLGLATSSTCFTFSPI
jgi:hypothetical protein